MPVDFSMPEMLLYTASCMTLLRNCHVRQTKPIAIICDTITQQDALARRCRVFSDNMKYSFSYFSKNTHACLSERKDDVLYVQFSSSYKHELELLCDYLAAGSCDGEPMNCLVCVLFKGYIPGDVTDCFSLIVPSIEVEKYLQKNRKNFEIQELIQRRSNDFLTLRDQLIYKMVCREQMDDDDALLYTSAVIRTFLENAEEQLPELFDIVMEKHALSEASRDQSDLADLFVDILYLNTEFLYPMLSYYDVVTLDENGGSSVLYDDLCYYFPESTMSRVLQKMKAYASSVEVKHQLVEAGYLEVQGGSRMYYTKKVTIQGKRCYFYCLRRDCIDRAGEPTLAAICDLKGDEDNDFGKI